jgi:hypothetical protein
LDDRYFGWHHKDFTCASSREDGAGFPLHYFSLSQIPLGGNMKSVVIGHQDIARLYFETFIKGLRAHLLEYYYSGFWINDQQGSFPTQAFVYGMVDRIMLFFAKEYYSPDHFNKDSPSFVLVTARPPGSELAKLPYPLDVDLLSGDPGLHEFIGQRLAIFERLRYFYNSPPAALIYASVTTSIDNLIDLVLGDVFVQMERGDMTNVDPTKMPKCPPTRICIAMRIQDVPIDSRLVIGSDIAWIPVVPHGEFMSTIMDRILGYEEPEEKPVPPWEPTYEDLKLSDLSEQQITAAQALNKGPIHGVYRENKTIFIIMKNDLDHIYEWRGNVAGSTRPGYWARAKERMVYPKLLGSGARVYRF